MTLQQERSMYEVAEVHRAATRSGSNESRTPQGDCQYGRAYVPGARHSAPVDGRGSLGGREEGQRALCPETSSGLVVDALNGGGNVFISMRGSPAQRLSCQVERACGAHEIRLIREIER